LENISLEILIATLFALFILSAFFSSSETSMMALNRYRLKHLAKEGHRGAKLAENLLEKPDRLLGLILLGNNLVNIFSASITTVIGLRLYGDLGFAIAPIVLTVLVLIFAEVAPKTIAALYPESIAFPAAYILTFLGKLLYPFVWLINLMANTLLSIFRINPENTDIAPLSREELRTVVQEAGHMIPIRHKKMLISILDLENSIVDDIMVPRNELEGIDLTDNPDDIIEQIANCQHTRILVYEDNVDNVKGILHARKFPRILSKSDQLTAEDIASLLDEPYFVPMGTPLHVQLRFFQKQKIRLGLVVDEYGDIQGIVTMEDILEEIVGEFTTDIQTYSQDINFQEDGSILIDGTSMLRDINRQLHWNLPLDGPKTLNGLILENLEHIPESGTSLKVGEYMLEILQSGDNAVKKVKVEQLEPQATSPHE
jgi:Mg2+/Co2+ transporter CorB